MKLKIAIVGGFAALLLAACYVSFLASPAKPKSTGTASATTPISASLAPESPAGTQPLRDKVVTSGSASDPAEDTRSQAAARIPTGISPQTPPTSAPRPKSSVKPQTLIIESPRPEEGSVEVVIGDKRLVPFVLQGETDPGLPIPIQQVLQNISDEYAENLLAAADASNPSASQGASASGGTTGAGGATGTTAPATVEPPSTVISDEALRSARDIADQRYRAFFGDAAFNQAGLRRAVESTSQAPQK